MKKSVTERTTRAERVASGSSAGIGPQDGFEARAPDFFREGVVAPITGRRRDGEGTMRRAGTELDSVPNVPNGTGCTAARRNDYTRNYDHRP